MSRMSYSQIQDGYMSTGGGLNWFRRLKSSNIDFASGIEGTYSWYRWNRLKACRCRKCQIILYHYGARAQKQPAEPSQITGGPQKESP